MGATSAASAASTALVTLGRLPKALDIARALQASGWRVIVAEPYARHLTGASRAVSRSFRVTAPTLDPDEYGQLGDPDYDATIYTHYKAEPYWL